MDRKKTLISCALGCGGIVVLLAAIGGWFVYSNREVIQSHIDSGKEFLQQSTALRNDLNKEFNVAVSVGIGITNGVSSLQITIENANIPQGQEPRAFAKTIAIYAAGYPGFDDYDKVEVELLQQSDGIVKVSNSHTYEWSMQELQEWASSPASDQASPQNEEADQQPEPKEDETSAAPSEKENKP